MRFLPPVPGGDRPTPVIHIRDERTRGRAVCGVEHARCVEGRQRDQVTCSSCLQSLVSAEDEVPPEQASDGLAPIRALQERDADAAHFAIEDSEYETCAHRGRKSISHAKRTVRCMDCNALVDPFDALAEMANFAHRQWIELRQVRGKVADCEHQLEDVKRRLGNEKAKLRRAVANRMKRAEAAQ